LVRTLILSTFCNEYESLSLLNPRFSKVARAPDWILDLHPTPLSPGNAPSKRCVAVTAHNALLDIRQDLENQYPRVETLGHISVSELTSSSRSILYSAHLLWESTDRILVAAGTAFGEIIYWSWDQSRPEESRSHVHHVFLGHEGSIFGVQISKKLSIDGRDSRRLLASCSDDRTIRIWDVSRVTAEEGCISRIGDPDLQRTRHTGFNNASVDTDVPHKDCLAIGWGHTSRVWKVSFLDSDFSSNKIVLFSTGEDATSRTWRLVTSTHENSISRDVPPWQLDLVDTAAHHNGKNVWSMSIPDKSLSNLVTLGGADSKITSSYLRTTSQSAEQTHQDLEFFAAAPVSPEDSTVVVKKSGHRSSKQTEFLRSYAFVDEFSFILTTNSGGIFLETLSSGYSTKIDGSKLIAKLEDLSGYSVCAGEHSLGIAFVAGAKGSLYAYSKETSQLTKLYTVNGKIGEIFAGSVANSLHSKRMVVLVTLVGQKAAQLLEVDLSECVAPQFLYEDLSTNARPTVSSTTVVPITDDITGLVITSMVYIDASDGSYVVLGYRRGSAAAYRIADQREQDSGPRSAELIGFLHSIHGKETVTAMAWVSNGTSASSGYLISTGRDGCVAIHLIDLRTMSYHLVHNITLPVGPNIEGLYIRDGELNVYGFSHKEFIVYNTITEEVTMNVETGGAHRSWSFQPNYSLYRGGNLVWTRASSMHIHSQPQPNHDVIRSGGHGREIKAVAVSPVIETNGSKTQLIATGSEDTDIKIFLYANKHLTCLRTLRKHKTGIQNLQWSADGTYLFSSGGCEEFYVWKISRIPSELGGIGVVCEASCPPESEHSDLRIMAFHAAQHSEARFVISMVFSNSMVKV
jgi:WD40 repeat protein